MWEGVNKMLRITKWIIEKVWWNDLKREINSDEKWCGDINRFNSRIRSIKTRIIVCFREIFGFQ